MENWFAIPNQIPYTDCMKNKNTIPTEVQDEITYIPIPEGVDIDIVSEIIGDDMYDIIFLDEGIVCSNNRVDDVKDAIEEAKEDSEDEE